MDDKLFEEMDNLNERETDQLLDSIDVKHLKEEIDKDATERIKAEVLHLHPLDENHIIGFGKDTAGGNENTSFVKRIIYANNHYILFPVKKLKLHDTAI